MAKFRPFSGGKAARTLERCRGWARAVELAEKDTQRLSDDELRRGINVLKQRHRGGESLDALLPEAFAIVREAAVRTLGERAHAEQIIGAAALHLGSVVEMKTGEGKTLTAVLTACLHAVADNGVHVLTANDYLAARDAEWMRPVYSFLGFRNTLLTEGGTPAERQDLYAADVVYGTANAFAYDYLRDNMVHTQTDVVQRGHFSAIVDEADLVMLDDAALLPQISGPADVAPDYAGPAAFVVRLERGAHYTVDESRRAVSLTDAGTAVVEAWHGGAVDAGLARRVREALEARELYVRDRDYVIVDGAIQIIDGSTRRAVADRRLSDGLDQALDAKESLDIRPRQRTLAITDIRAYLGLYARLAGLTGVVEGEVEAYQDIYNRACVIVPPHQPPRRIDHDPVVYPNDAAMLRAMTQTVDDKRAAGRPVLVGTASDEMAARISRSLRAADIEHRVLDAKNHALEAEIIARAGHPGAVTVLTRMAGRGIDIRLTEPEGPGLFVLGIGPLATRRQELHLRGRAGRGGDPGESVFYLSFDDPHLQLPGPVGNLDDIETDGPIISWLLKRSVAAKLTALSTAEIKRLTLTLRYAAVREEQRAALYTRRADVLKNGLTRDQVDGIIATVMRSLVLDARTGPQDVDRLSLALRKHYPSTISGDTIAAGLAGNPTSKARADLVEAVVRDAHAAAAARESELGADVTATLAQRVMLSVMDRLWRAQLQDLEDAQDRPGLRTLGADEALATYQRGAARLATAMWEEIDMEFVGYWFNLAVTVG